MNKALHTICILTLLTEIIMSPSCTQHSEKTIISAPVNPDTLHALLQPANQYVISYIPVIAIKPDRANNDMEVTGVTDYDTRRIGNISAKVSGRIEKLYVKTTFQEVMKGQRIMDIYSSELSTAQQNLQFLEKNDASNTSLVNAAKQKLYLLGVSPAKMHQAIKTRAYTTSVYSNYSGHIHEMESGIGLPSKPGNFITKQLNLKEGMFVQKGQTLFSVYDPHRLAALIDINPEQQTFIKVGTEVKIIPEAAPSKTFQARVSFIEPFLREGSKTVKARIYFDNSSLDIPVGSQLRAIIYGKAYLANWLPKEAVLSLGTKSIVFLKGADGFKAHSVTTGIINNNQIEIVSGLSTTDSVAVNAQYLMDAESTIKVK